MIKLELKRALTGKLFWIVLALAFAVTLLNTWETFQISQNDVHMTEQIGMEQKEWVVLSVFSAWIGVETYTSGYSLYFYLFPLFVALVYGWSFSQDRETGYLHQVISRVGRKSYYLAKYIATFVSGGLVMVLPMLGNLLIGMTYRNLAVPDPLYTYFNMSPLSFMGEIYYHSPLLFCFLYLVVDFFFGGALACVSMTLTFWLRKKIFVLVIPFLALIAWDYVALNLLVEDNSIYTASILRMAHPGPLLYDNPGGAFLTVVFLLILITFTVCMTRGARDDVF